MDRSSRLEYPRLVTDDVVAYWYFYLPYRAISQGHPSEFLIAKIAKILEEIQADFRPTVLWGKWPTRNGQLPPGGSDTFSFQRAEGFQIGNLREKLISVVATSGGAGTVSLALCSIKGATRVAYPADGEVRETFIDSTSPGPWNPAEVSKFGARMDEIIHFGIHDLGYRETVDIALMTNSSIWWSEWPGFPRTPADQARNANRLRLRRILSSLHRALPEAEVEHHSEGPVPTSLEGFNYCHAQS